MPEPSPGDNWAKCVATAKRPPDDFWATSAPPLKRPRTEPLQPRGPPLPPAWGPDEFAAEGKKLLQRWGLGGDVASSYVIGTLAPEELQELAVSGFSPNFRDTRRCCAEQINNRAFQLREKMGPSGGALDPIEAFGYRWHLQETTDGMLRELPLAQLRHVLREYTGLRSLEEVVEEADEGSHVDWFPVFATPGETGRNALMRALRQEAIDASADALVLGDANLSFSGLLSRHRKENGHPGRVVATTFESLEQLQERYVEINDTIQQLRRDGAEVLHGVDCTQIATNPKFLGFEESFGAVYYNFPHAGAVRGFFDAHPFVHWRHENLMHLLFRALRAFVRPGGSVKVSSNSGAMGVRYITIIRAAALNEFVHVATLPFQEWTLSQYNRSFGDKRDQHKRLEGTSSYTAQRAEKDMVYCFTYSPTGVQPPKCPIRRPPSCSDLFAATCACRCGFICPSEMRDTESCRHHLKPSGPHQTLEGQERQAAVVALYKRFLSELSGQHIG